MRFYTISILGLLVLSTQCLAEKGLRFESKDATHTILPCGYSKSTILGFAPSGEMLEFDPAKIQDPKVIPRFRPYSQGQMRGDLLREFGKQFQVTGTGSYLVVHPKGARDLWANRFEELYRSMMHFLRQRGFHTQRPKFPLVGIVFYSKSQYEQYMSRVVGTNASNSYGIYMSNTNRIYLYDATQGQGKESREWGENLATVMHEAAHQTAFNCGVHTRLGQTPKWGIEGLGCLFEAQGIYDAFHHRKIEDRLNVGRLRDFKHMRKSLDLEPLMMDMVASENVFKRRPSQAYAMAWALTFYLSEKQPRDYIRFLKKTSKLGPFDTYSQSQRVRDFQKIFGRDSKMLMTRVGRFVDELRLDEG